MTTRRAGTRPSLRRVLFVGNRPLVFEAALSFAELEIEWTWAVSGSYFEERLRELGRDFETFAPADSARLVEELARTPFDVLVSNGCPIVLPVSRLARPGRVFLNVHPSPLPEMRGLHPLNGALVNGRRHVGATMHHMGVGVDSGRLIRQERIEVTDDLDLGLLYHMVFRLEATVFRAGMCTMIDSAFGYVGEEHAGAGSYYSRRDEDMHIDLAGMDDDEILRRVRSFGVRTQGVSCRIGTRAMRVFEARAARHPALLAEFEALAPGSLALAYDGKLLVRTRQGLVVLTSFSEIYERPATAVRGWQGR